MSTIFTAHLVRSRSTAETGATGWGWDGDTNLDSLPPRWRQQAFVDWLRTAASKRSLQDPGLVAARDGDVISVARLVDEHVTLVTGFRDLTMAEAVRLRGAAFWSRLDQGAVPISGDEIDREARRPTNLTEPDALAVTFIDQLLRQDERAVVSVAGDRMRMCIDALAIALSILPEGIITSCAMSVSKVDDGMVDLLLAPEAAAVAWRQNGAGRAVALEVPEGGALRTPTRAAQKIGEAALASQGARTIQAALTRAVVDPRGLEAWANEMLEYYDDLPLGGLDRTVAEDAPLAMQIRTGPGRANVFRLARDDQRYWTRARISEARDLLDSGSGELRALGDQVRVAIMRASSVGAGLVLAQRVGIRVLPVDSVASALGQLAEHRPNDPAIWDAAEFLEGEDARSDRLRALLAPALGHAPVPGDRWQFFTRLIERDAGLINVASSAATWPLDYLERTNPVPERLVPDLLGWVLTSTAEGAILLAHADQRRREPALRDALLLQALLRGADPRTILLSSLEGSTDERVRSTASRARLDQHPDPSRRARPKDLPDRSDVQVGFDHGPGPHPVGHPGADAPRAAEADPDPGSPPDDVRYPPYEPVPTPPGRTHASSAGWLSKVAFWKRTPQPGGSVSSAPASGNDAAGAPRSAPPSKGEQRSEREQAKQERRDARQVKRDAKQDKREAKVRATDAKRRAKERAIREGTAQPDASNVQLAVMMVIFAAFVAVAAFVFIFNTKGSSEDPPAATTTTVVIGPTSPDGSPTTSPTEPQPTTSRLPIGGLGTNGRGDPQTNEGGP